MQHNQLYTVQQVAKLLCVSVSGVWDKARNQPDFPKPMKVSAKQTRWTYAQLDSFIQGRLALSQAQ